MNEIEQRKKSVIKLYKDFFNKLNGEYILLIYLVTGKIKHTSIPILEIRIFAKKHYSNVFVENIRIDTTPNVFNADFVHMSEILEKAVEKNNTKTNEEECEKLIYSSEEQQ